MARCLCVCAAVLLAAVCQATNIVKGLYCQDPDTGNLHPVNSTWPSQTFCGNYTCKLRKKNTTETEYAPIHKIDITKFHIKDPADTENDMATSPSLSSIALTKTDIDKQPIYHKDVFETKVAEQKINNDLKDNDGYLTEPEIRTIIDMLQTVKRSDLEAIVEIYNLAQDIYKEIDTNRTENLVTETKGVRKMDKIEEIRDDKQSYWYEPVHYHDKHLDMSHEGTSVITTNKPTLESNPVFKTVKEPFQQQPPAFKEPLSERYFGKQQYYYPISNFQRLASYMHSKPKLNDLEKSPSEAKPCSKPTNHYNYVALPWYNVPSKKPELTTVLPSRLLPYPFSYIYHNNVSGYQPNYYYNYPWTHAEYNRHRKYLQPYYGTYFTQIPSNGVHSKVNIPEKGKSSESNISEEQIPEKVKAPLENKLLPDWQTGPLSENVLDEVRAYMDKPKHRPLPLKKNIKLERVGKVIKLDEFTRQRREVRNNDTDNNANETFGDEMEVYIEKTVCENSTELGYFSVGNLSQPYPACCPKKLDSLHIAQEVIKIN